MGNKQFRYIRAFRFQKSDLFIDAARIPRNAAACADNAVAGNDERYTVVTDRAVAAFDFR